MPCPTCKRETVHEFRPFCSKQCAHIDLHKWLNEGYSLEAHDQTPIEGEMPTIQYVFEADED